MIIKLGYYELEEWIPLTSSQYSLSSKVYDTRIITDKSSLVPIISIGIRILDNTIWCHKWLDFVKPLILEINRQNLTDQEIKDQIDNILIRCSKLNSFM